MNPKSIALSEYAKDHKIPTVLFCEELGSEGISYMTKNIEEAIKVANQCGVSSLIIQDEQWACDPKTHEIYLERIN